MAAEKRLRGDTTPSRTSGRRSTGQPGPVTPGAISPISERVLVGDLENGLPTFVNGTLHPSDLHTGSRSSSEVNPIGVETGEYESLNAHRGHLLGDVLGGSGRDIGNLALLHKKVNLSAYRVQFENPVRAALDAGKSVHFDIKPVFKGDELAPYKIEVWASTAGGQIIVPPTAIRTPGMSHITR